MSALTPPLGKGDHVLGPATTRVTLVEYGDFECSYCGRAHSVVNEVLLRIGDRTRFAFRHFPLSQSHPHALAAAQAAEAAGAQKKFWRMYRMLYEHQTALEPEDLVAYAEELELDVSRFVEELTTEVHLKKVKEDFQSGIRSGVNGTPTFFVNGQRLDQGWDKQTLLSAIAHAA
jgi:protein-disulfide isomerase